MHMQNGSGWPMVCAVELSLALQREQVISCPILN